MYCDYIVKWCSGVACNWSVSLDIFLMLALSLEDILTQLITFSCFSLIRDLQLVIKDRLTTRQLTIAKDILDKMLTIAESQE